MMGSHKAIVFLCLLSLAVSSSCHPLCTDSTAPLTLNTSLEFCPYSGRSCCNSTQDSELEKKFQAMNISDPDCSAVVKSMICASCDPFSGELFTVNSALRPVPLLCNSTGSTNSPADFCSETWEKCKNVSMLNSPFAPSLQGRGDLPDTSNSTKLTDLWQSKADFCNAFGGASKDESLCFSGGPVALNNTETPDPPHGLCLEKIGNGSYYLNMAAHPDGSDHAFFGTQQGRIFLATLPKQGSGEVIVLDEADPFVDLTDQVHFSAEFGMMGMAFHPKFAENGRFFASFNCDKAKWPGCSGRCSCNSDVRCDPSKLSPDAGAQPCQVQTVVAEYSANGSGSDPASATEARPQEVRRIFTMGLPSTRSHGGQILFRPSDGYLYFMMGDGGVGSYNFAQNKKSLLGKIMRLDVDRIPSESEIDKRGLWGNYSTPKDNPYREDPELLPEIWALGMRNPWRCSFDSERPSYFMCADVGEDTFEEVDLITRGGNYGWRFYEGDEEFVPKSSPSSSPGGNTTIPSNDSINPIFPLMGYTHDEINKKQGSASITGGYFYRSQADPCTYGMYLYADLYASSMWAGIEDPEFSGNFTAHKIAFTCAQDSPIKCDAAPGSNSSSIGYVYSFGEDNRKDVYVLTSKGIYRVVRPSRCNFACSKENATAQGSPAPATAPPSGSAQIETQAILALLLVLLLVVVW